MADLFKVVRQWLRLLSEANAAGFGGGDALRLALTAFLFAFLLRHLGEQVRHKQS